MADSLSSPPVPPSQNSSLLSSLVSLHSSSQGFLLILFSTPAQKSLISHYLQNDQTVPPIEITSELPAHSLHAFYSSNGVFFITSRILIVDLLTSKLPISCLTGLVILNAHGLSDTCTEAFIVRIVKSRNRDVCIRAFSDRPYALVSGFAKAEKIMTCLYIRRLHLWPRFKVYVSQELEKDPPEVVDMRVPMSKYMMEIQKAIVEVMDACLKEMRKTNKVDVEDLTVENGLFKSFDEIVRRQLDPIWHTLGRKTKQLVSDLKTLRKLLDYLVRYDAVTFLKYLDSLRASESFRSVWIFAESSYKIFDYAKKRVYHLVRSDGVRLSVQEKTTSNKKRKLREINNAAIEANDGSSSRGNAVLVEKVLEEAPKWQVLREVLEEIEEERQKRGSSEGLLVDDQEDNNGIVLVACKDERSSSQIEDCIMNGSQKVMTDEWENYLLSKVELHGLQTRKKKKGKEPKGFGILNGVAPSSSGQNTEASIINKQEHEALLAAASAIKSVASKEDVIEVEPEKVTERRSRGQRKRMNNKSPAKVQVAKRQDNCTETEVTRGNNSEVSGSKNDGEIEEGDTGMPSRFHQGSSGPSLHEAILRKLNEKVDSELLANSKPLPPVYFHALEGDQPILDILKPSVIVVYHPDMTFVREIEVYKAENPCQKLKVFFIFYEDSTEVQKFEAGIRRENGAFESLIWQKSMMMIPVDQDGYCLGLNASIEAQTPTSQNSITRKAGGRKEVEKEMQVIVDMREFMSSLPNVLHQKGMRIIPVTLEVGDYILSPLICVERKSISDLFMSFTSGRLYNQVEMMICHYRIPVLLIEFSQDKSFSFQSASDIGDDVTPNNIISKLSLLALHFPRLCIIWSRSLYATAEIFAFLKVNQDEPDEVKATRVGVPSEEGIVENDIRAENYNTSAVEFLRRLPGVTDSIIGL